MHTSSTNKPGSGIKAVNNWAIFTLAFRPFFFLGALFSTIIIIVWGLTWSGIISFSPFGGALYWHMHEMLFGFVVIIMSGFLLTAVRNWTGIETVKGMPLAVLALLWLVGRSAMAFPIVPEMLVMLLDLAFLPAVAVCLAIPIVKVKLWRNLFFVPIFLLMATLNGLMHASVQGLINISYIHLSHLMILMVTLVMCIMGGRVFPMFTANGTQTSRVPPIAWLEKLSLGSLIAAIILMTDILPFDWLTAIILLVAGIVNFARALRWRIQVTLKTPLLWSLHLSYWSICLGLVLLGLVKLGLFNQASLAWHTLTVGGMGLMILSMISRVSLGHTGRPLAVGKIMMSAYLLMLLALLSRVFAPLIFDAYQSPILLSAIFWASAYGMFVVVYFPVLLRPRIDGCPG